MSPTMVSNATLSKVTGCSCETFLGLSRGRCFYRTFRPLDLLGHGLLNFRLMGTHSMDGGISKCREHNYTKENCSDLEPAAVTGGDIMFLLEALPLGIHIRLGDVSH